MSEFTGTRNSGEALFVLQNYKPGSAIVYGYFENHVLVYVGMTQAEPSRFSQHISAVEYILKYILDKDRISFYLTTPLFEPVLGHLRTLEYSINKQEKIKFKLTDKEGKKSNFCK